MRFAVITPTIGTPLLKQCIESLRGQNCTHHLFVDGSENSDRVQEILDSISYEGLHLSVNLLDRNVGKGWYGHRVYAASAYIINEDVLCYLDEDNWVEPSYIAAFERVLNTQPWAYTLRKIVDVDGSYVCDDNCESLGNWPVVGDRTRYHIDTGCFAVPKTLALQVSPAWYGQWGADRQFFNALKQTSPQFGCTQQHTLNYRLGGETSRATKDMFLRGNQMAYELHKGEYPWHHETTQKPTTLTYSTLRTNNRLL